VLLPETYHAHFYIALETQESMSQPKNRKLSKPKGFSRPLVLAALLTSGSLQFIGPAIAQTAADKEISNTATATYEDDDSNDYNATSNTVKIKVKEVAGIEITAQTPSNTSPNAGQSFYVDFVIKNSGNDPTKIFIPNTATLKDSGGTVTTKFELDGPLKVVGVDFDNDGTNDLGSPVDVSTTGNGSQSDTLFGSINGGSINAGGTITVRVNVKAKGTALKDDTVKVSLGNTDPVNQDNQTRKKADGTAVDEDNDDVYTVDNSGTTNGDISGAPGNGVREAMDTSAEIKVAARLQAFAKILKATASYTPGALDQADDDKLTYALGLDVAGTTSVAGLAASDLYGTALTVTGGTVGHAYVLVSDVIPAGTEFDSSVTPTTPTTGPTAGNWQVVYSVTGTGTLAQNATWTTTAPSDTSTIKRIGFIYNTTVNGAIDKGTQVSGFKFGVKTQSTFTGGTIANMAQVFGQSQPGTPEDGTATQIVYDESGDQDANNKLDGTNPDGLGDNAGGINNGVGTPAKDGVDPGTGTDPFTGTNTGKDPANGGAGTDGLGGEVTVKVILAAPLNGPENKPGAKGPDGTTATDFTHQSIALASGKDPGDKLTDAETPAITFKNTVKHSSDDNQDLRLTFNTPASLPNDTIVEIDADNDGTFETEYKVVGGVLVKQSGPDPVISNVAKNVEKTYQVKVNLPGDVSQNEGFDVPIVAYIDNGDGSFNATNDPNNVTTNRVYTGYLKLTKAARILASDGTTVLADYSATNADKNAAALPGNIIEYKVTYENISKPLGSGVDSKVLNANNLVITEDGDTAPNNWFEVTTGTGTPADSNGSPLATITTTSDSSKGSPDIKIYTDTITKVVPGAQETTPVTGSFGSFTFQRKIN
jgi:hypothetical protein